MSKVLHEDRERNAHPGTDCDRKAGMGGVCLESKKHQRLGEQPGPLERPNSAATPASAFRPPEPQKSTFLLLKSLWFVIPSCRNSKAP